MPAPYIFGGRNKGLSSNACLFALSVATAACCCCCCCLCVFLLWCCCVFVFGVIDVCAGHRGAIGTTDRAGLGRWRGQPRQRFDGRREAQERGDRWDGTRWDADWLRVGQAARRVVRNGVSLRTSSYCIVYVLEFGIGGPVYTNVPYRSWYPPPTVSSGQRSWAVILRSLV